MDKIGIEWKVGIFVLLALVLAAGLIMKFSKGVSAFTSTYEILLITSNVGGIRPGAAVLMAGVDVGTVRSIDLDQSGKTVTLHVQVQSKYQIHQDARFTIEQAGFLGDQYISVTPAENNKPPLRNGDRVACEEPFNLQEVARSAAGLLRRVDQTAAKLNEAVARIDQTILSERTLTNFSGAVVNFRVASERALTTLSGVDQLVQSNSSPLSVTISNLVQFSEELDGVTTELRLAVETNRVEITSTIKNLERGTSQLNELLADLQNGRGMAGAILKDDTIRGHFATTMSNLTVVSSNLSAHGLLWKPRPRRIQSATPIYPGKMPDR